MLPSAIHVVAGLDAKYGGASYSVPRLCHALAAEGCRLSLYSVAGEDASAEAGDARPFEDWRFKWDMARLPGLRAMRISSGLDRALRADAARVDVIHNHGLWLAPNLSAGRSSQRLRKPLVVSPRGMLNKSALSISRMKKRAMWLFFQEVMVRRAACIHATSQMEFDEIRALGLGNPAAIIPNGVDVPEKKKTGDNQTNKPRTVLSLGRIHPIKGLDRLILAWAEVESSYPDWHLKIVGPDEVGHAQFLRQLAQREGLVRLSIEGEIYGPDKFDAYREADLFVLPTLSENFGLTVAESLAVGTPAIATKGAPWRVLATERCGWWIDHGVEPLASALKKAMETPRQQLTAMGLRGRDWVSRELSWERVGRDMLEVYRWLSGYGDCPSTVRLD